MSKPSFYDKLTDEEKKEYDNSIKKASNTSKESYVEKNIDSWVKFLAGHRNITDFKRESKKADSPYQYFFTRNGKTCFQYKSFVADLLEAIALQDGLNAQRKSMMKYELVKFLRGGQKFSRAGDKAETETDDVSEELNDVARRKEKEKQAIRNAKNLQKAVVQKELNALAKQASEPIATTRPSFEKMAEEAEQARKEKEDADVCPYADGTPQANRWHLNRD